MTTTDFATRIKNYTETNPPTGGCHQGKHSRHWIGCRYCETNRTENRRLRRTRR